MKTGQAKDASKVEHLVTETKRLQSIINDMKMQISDLEGRNSHLERQYADLLRQHIWSEISIEFLKNVRLMAYSSGISHRFPIVNAHL